VEDNMKPPPFEYVRPTTAAEAVAQLVAGGEDAKLLAGGQSLIPLLNFRLANPRVLVDLNGVEELAYLDASAAGLRIGAMTRIRDLELSRELAQHNPLISHAVHWIGHVQIRNRGTVGGSLAHADPAAELPALSVLLGAEMHVIGPKQRRTVSADGFFHGLMSTALSGDELLTEIRIPALERGSRWGFEEFAQRHGDFAVAGAACVLAGRDSRLVVFGLTSAPVRCTEAEAQLAHGFEPGKLDHVMKALRSDLDRLDGSAEREYQRRVAEVMAARALENAVRGDKK
jgi:CO/xanthine dehydrogenase FAD-binding subunit